MAADASKLNLTLLQQMAESKAKYIATEKTRKENAARLIALRAAQEVAEAQTNTPSIEADIRSEIDLVASDTVRFMLPPHPNVHRRREPGLLVLRIGRL